VSLFDRYTPENPPKVGDKVWWAAWHGELPMIWRGARDRHCLVTGSVHRSQKSAQRYVRALQSGGQLAEALSSCLPAIEREADRKDIELAWAAMDPVIGREIEEGGE
jgi:hypothetical protein